MPSAPVISAVRPSGLSASRAIRPAPWSRGRSRRGWTVRSASWAMPSDTTNTVRPSGSKATALPPGGLDQLARYRELDRSITPTPKSCTIAMARSPRPNATSRTGPSPDSFSRLGSYSRSTPPVAVGAAGPGHRGHPPESSGRPS